MSDGHGIKVNGNAQRRDRQSDVRNIPKPFRDVARGMEQQFIQYMVEQMKKTISPNKEESSALKFYNSVLNQYQSDIMAKKNEGLGLQKVILDQIYPAHKRQNLNPKYGIKQYRENDYE